MKLLIAIPALNEEDSIAQIIERCLLARPQIIADSPVTEVEITVVSDGSTDRTVELASGYVPRIKLIVFVNNRGYGAAIQEAWSQSDADLLGFLDADGTCEPSFFAPLCRTVVERKASVALGSRMHSGSKMPLIRRTGNMVFALLLTVFSSARVKDSASGMRVVRRDCLDLLMPLPNGLDFTPAMSARCILASGLPIHEIDVPYHERAGRSKLRVIKDGLRFLGVILKTALLHRPARLLGIAALVCTGVASLLMVGPTLYYLRNRSVAEWMIYRFVVSHLLGTAGVLFFSMASILAKVVRLTLSGAGAVYSHLERSARWMEGPALWVVLVLLLTAGGALVYPSYRELITTGVTYEHWSRFIVMSFLVTSAIILGITRVISFILTLVGDRLAYLSSLAYRRRTLNRTAGQ